MKNTLILLAIILTLPSAQSLSTTSTLPIPETAAENLIIITIDGVRWQEIFNGGDPELMNDTAYNADPELINMLFSGENESERRQRLMPFFWNILNKKAQLYGNRHYQNKVNTSNIYSFSYPGYNEIFTGGTDLAISSNKKVNNNNTNVLAFLNQQEQFKNKVAAFTSWDVFPYILHEENSNLFVNSGYESVEFDTEHTSVTNAKLNATQENLVYQKSGTRHDQLTYIAAKEHLQQHRPRVLFLGLGETDEFAHHGQYDQYLLQLNKVDAMLADLWYWVQRTPGYRNNTSFIITTDHGRGSRHSKWTSHSTFIKGSSQTWLALAGPGIEPLGEVKEKQQFYQRQLAELMANLVGEQFTPEITRR